MISEFLRRLLGLSEGQSDEPSQKPAAAAAPAAAPSVSRPGTRCIVANTTESDRAIIASALKKQGIDIDAIGNLDVLVEAVAKLRPNMIFVGVSPGQEDQVGSILGQIPSGAALLVAVQFVAENGHVDQDILKRVAAQHAVRTLPPLTSPVKTADVETTIQLEGLALDASGGIAIDLGMALRQGWIEFWYQPKVALRRRVVVGAELLARVRHPTHGVLPPSSFLNRASAADLTRLGVAGVETALTDWEAFLKLHLNLRLAVNVPMRGVEYEPIVRAIERQTHKADWPGLIFDIDEADILASKREIADLMNYLVPHKVEIAIDNFGTLNSEPSMLHGLQFAELKISRKLVHHCSEAPARLQACQMLCKLAHEIKAAAVATGLEAAKDVQALRDVGCDLGQGNVFSPPLRRAQFATMLTRQLDRSQSETRAETKLPFD